MSDVEGIERINIRAPRAVIDGLRRLARQHDRSLNRECVQALRTYIEINTPAPRSRRPRKDEER